MIKLCVKPYCHNCDLFKPHIKKSKYEHPNGYVETIRKIECEYKDICTIIDEYEDKQFNAIMDNLN